MIRVTLKYQIRKHARRDDGTAASATHPPHRKGGKTKDRRTRPVDGHATDTTRAGQLAPGQFSTGGNGGRAGDRADELSATNGKASAGHGKTAELSSGSFTVVQLVSAVEHALGNSASVSTPVSQP